MAFIKQVYINITPHTQKLCFILIQIAFNIPSKMELVFSVTKLSNGKYKQQNID